MTFWLALLVGIVGAIAGEWWGFLVGAALGGLLGAVLELRGRLAAAETLLRQWRDETASRSVAPRGAAAAAEHAARSRAALDALPQAPPDALPDAPPDAAPQGSEQDDAAQGTARIAAPAAAASATGMILGESVERVIPPAGPAPAGPAPSGTEAAGTAQTPGRRQGARQPTDAFDPDWTAPDESTLARAVAVVRDFATTGNVVAKVGVVVLFFGVAFLLKYAYDNAHFPPALRLIGSAVAGVTLLSVGWRLRGRGDAYGLLLQGAGIGVLYLTVFAAARLYGLVPLSAAFLIMAVIVAASCVLAVVQNSEPLAVLAMSGGFLAPVLTSTGAGSHVALFSFYELLNLGILAMAALRVWRWLNWTGFLFTFVIAGVWGARFYRPEYFATVEPFLIVFFLHYIGVIALTTRQRALALSGVADGSLVFGLPIVAFALQAALVADMHLGLAFSALGTAAVYVVALWGMGRAMAVPPVVRDSFSALALIFASLTLPLGFDNQRWTAASWAVEGAGLVWLGLRQQRAFNRWFGVALQLLAGVAFAWSADADVADRAVLNSFFLGCALIANAAWFTSVQYASHATRRPRRDALVSGAVMAWGVLWWLGGVARECASAAPAGGAVQAFVLIAAVTFAMLAAAGARLQWRAAGFAGLAWLPLLALVWGAASTSIGAAAQSPFVHGGWWIWPVCVAALWICLRLAARVTGAVAHGLLNIWHGATLLLATAIVSWFVGAALEAHGGAVTIWSQIVWALPTVVIVALLPRLTAQPWWPMTSHAAAYSVGGAVLAVVALLWVASGARLVGDPAPLSYLPIVNPLELTQAAVLLATWQFAAAWYGVNAGDPLPARAGITVVAFIWLNTIAARSVHFFGGVAFDAAALWRAALFQASLSLLWSSLALIVMFVAARQRARPWWVGGALLLAAVVVKLLLVDLSDIGTVPRIVSFLGVGVLMLLIGYVAPLPRGDAGEAVDGPPQAGQAAQGDGATPPAG